MKTFKKMLKGFLILILALFLGVCVSIFLAFNIAGYEVLQITSDDMEPDLYNGDVIVLKSVTVDDVDINDIIMFQVGYNKITHKVVAKENGVLSTKGSNLENIDVISVDNTNLRGKMLTKLTGGKHFILFVTNTYNMLIVVCITLCLLAIPIIMHFSSKDNELEEEN